MGPDSNACKKVALGKSLQVARVDIFNTPFINIAGSNVPGINQVAQPGSGVLVYFVVVSSHALTPWAA
jgi:hypothetical protein